MADEPLPTWDEALATARLPTWEQAMRREEMLNQYTQTLTGVGTGGAEAYAGVNSGDGPDAFFSSGPAANILSAFGQGAAQEWGAIASGSLSPETEAALKKGGWFNDYDTNRRSLVKSFNEGLFRSAATAYHGFNALMGGTHEALIAAAKEGGPIVGAPFAAAVGAMEAFPVGHGTGFPARLPRALVEANDLKIIGYGEPGWKGLPSPTQVAIDALRPAQEVDRPATRLEFTPEEELPVATTPSDRTPEIHARAREIAPDTFREYDELTQQRETLRQHLEELRGGSQVRDLDEQIQALRAQNLEVPPGAERLALNNQVIELERQREVLADQLGQGRDTPQMALVRKALQETDFRMRDLAPDVSAAYRTAAGEARPGAEAAPSPAEAPVAAPPIDDPLAMQRRGELTAARAAEIRDELGRTAPEEGAAEHLDPKIWTVIADNLEKAEGSREGAISVVADQMRYLPDDGVPKTISEREAMAVIGRAVDAEVARGGDVGNFLAEADAAHRAAGGRPGRGFVEAHEDDAAATPAELAPAVADQIRDERDAIAGERASPELDAERRAERGAAEDAGDAARGGIPDGGRDAGQPEPQGPGIDTGVGAVGAGGTEAAPQGVRGRGTGGGAAATEQPRTPNSPFPRGDTARIDKAGNIRLDNLGTAEDVNAVIREAAGQGNEFVAARRGVIPDSEVASLADALGMDAKQLDKRRLGEAFNAEQVLAARKLLVQSATNVRDLAMRVEGGTDADLMAYAEARARHMMIQEQVAGITAEAGRALRAFRAIEGAADAREIGLVLREETGRTLNQLRQEARMLSQLDTSQQVSKAVADMRNPTWKDMGIEAWINALLSGPATHVANMVGNAAVAVSSILETAIAAGIGVGRRAVGGPAAERVYMGEVAARAFGLVKGSQEGVIAAGKALLDENAVSQSPHTLEQRKFQAIPSVKVNVGGVEMNLGGAQIRLPGRLLTSEDELFKAIAFRQELNALAYRQAAGEGLTGDALHARIADLIEHPPDPMVEAAKSNEAYQTFTNPLGPTGRAAQMAINSSILAKVIVPFMRTPINLFKYAAERTPFGALSGEIRDNLIGRNGAVAQDTQIARLALGSAIAASIAGLASSTDAFPTITGAGPSDPAENAKLRQTGWQPYSMKIGNFYHSYTWLDPLATIMGMTADMTDAVKAGRADDANLGKVTSMVVANLSKNIMGKLSLRGTSDLIQALTDPDRYGSKWLQGITGSIVPSVVALSARIDDPVLREARTEWDALRARIPGLRQDLHPKIDVWGQPVPNQGALGPDILSRIYLSKISEDPVTLELQRLGKMPAKLDRKIVGVELTDSQYEDYARTAGVMAKMQLDRMINSPGFAQWPDFAKREVITKLVDGERERAQELMKQRYPVIWQTALEAKRATVHGATPEHVKSMLRNPTEMAPAGAVH